MNTAITFSVEEEVREREENGWEYSAYRIVTSTQGQSFVAIRRFKAFLGLHTALRVHKATLVRQSSVWVLFRNPHKRGSAYANEFLLERRVD